MFGDVGHSQLIRPVATESLGSRSRTSFRNDQIRLADVSANRRCSGPRRTEALRGNVNGSAKTVPREFVSVVIRACSSNVGVLLIELVRISRAETLGIGSSLYPKAFVAVLMFGVGARGFESVLVPLAS
jgi:hypothetical protein